MPVINGTPQNDTLNGTEDPDLIRGFNGDDILSGAGGNDEIEGGEGADQLSGNAGDDILRGGAGNDQVIEFGGGNDQLFGDDGADVLRYYKAISPAVVTALLDGGSGDDVIEYRGGDGGDFATLIGGTGSDRFFASGGGETITLDGGADADLVELELFTANTGVTLGAGADVVRLFGQLLPVSGNVITINDFAAGDSGDSINLADYLFSLASVFNTNPFASGVLQLSQNGADAVLSINLASFNIPPQTVVILKNVAAASLTAHNLGWSPNGSATAGNTLTGSAALDFLTGGGGDDQVAGAGGNDVIFGASGNDLVEGGDGDDELHGQRGNDDLRGGIGNDRLIDNNGDDDRLYGESGNDAIEVDHQYSDGNASQALLDGGDGADSLRFYGRLGAGDATLIGAGGSDIIVAYGGRAITIDAGTGGDFLQINMGAQSYAITLGAGIDTLSIVAPFGAGTLAQSAAFNVLDFAAGDGGDKLEFQFYLQSVLNGWDPATNPFALNYLRLAQSGDDAVLLIDTSGDGRFFKLFGTLADTSAAQLTQFNLGFAPAGAIGIAGTNGADSLLGTAAADEIFGLAGDDSLDGQEGADRLAGGLGNDTYLVDHALDLVLEGLGEGDDRVLASISYQLETGASVETLAAASPSGTGAIDLAGNAVANRIEGNDGMNLIRGEGGNDSLFGYSGQDFLVGGTGADVMVGGTGDDVYYVDDTSDLIGEQAGEGNDRIAASISLSLAADADIERIEAVNLTATNAMDLTGSAIANIIYGNDGANILRGEAGNDELRGFGGNDFLVGGTGTDLMVGGAGDDTFYVDNASDAIGEIAGEGNDRIAASVSFVLSNGAHVELLEAVNLLATTAFDLTGSDSANTITGNNGVNILRGEGGNDVLSSAGGDDFLVGGSGVDSMTGGSGNDTYYVDEAADTVVEIAGEGGNDRVATSVSYALSGGADVERLEAGTQSSTNAMNLTGSSIANIILGNDGANVLDGKGGGDTLTGFGGADTFQFTTAPGAGNVDTIAGFVSGSDRIALDDAIFAALSPGALGANAFVTGAAAADADDRIIYNSATGALFYDADGNGAGAAVQFATLSGAPLLVASDFAII